ncbi:TPA: ABC-2 transporter permease [Streptococcus pyogenes]
MSRIYLLSVRKDIILQKKYLLILTPLLIIANIFICNKLDGVVGELMGIFLIELFGIHVIFNSLCQAEDNEFGRNALIVSPYSRKGFVLGRYLFIALLFMYIYALNIIASNISNIVFLKFSFQKANLMMLSITALFLSFWNGINLTLYYKFGYSKMKILGNILVFLTPFILPTMTKYIETKINLSINFDPILLIVIFMILSFIMYIVSAMLSLYFFSKRDL